MEALGRHPSPDGLKPVLGSEVGRAYWNLSLPELYEHAIRRHEGQLTVDGTLVIETVPYTGRSPNDKFVVREPSTAGDIWWGNVNVPFEPEQYDALKEKIVRYFDGRDVFVHDVYACADPAYRLKIRIISELAVAGIFSRHMFINPRPDELPHDELDFTLLHAPGFAAEPEVDGTRSKACVLVNFAQKLILIGNTSYAGEIKKSIFTILNYLLPKRGVLSMHCSANVGSQGDLALFFGLSGTGKTSLSADPERGLIGDDEHGWGDSGVFNFEAGNYAKVIRLSPTGEPYIYAAIHRFGALLENVVVDPVTRTTDLDDDSLTENTRASYPITYIPNAVIPGVGPHPRNVVFLAADAFGALPPISRLTPEQAMYHFLAGYTAKLAGTERGVTEPKAAFSSCFGAPFLPLHPSEYARMLGEKIARHNVRVWLINTGWTGGPYGVGERIQIGYTRAMAHAALNGVLDGVEMRVDPFFGVHVPTTCPDVLPEMLNPRQTWRDKDAYDDQARRLAAMFAEHFEPYAGYVSQSVRDAAPPARA
jgi:phosphoenolpyruvate carboxykinase (ATP)